MTTRKHSVLLRRLSFYCLLLLLLLLVQSKCTHKISLAMRRSINHMRRTVYNRIVRAHIVQNSTERGSESFHGRARFRLRIPGFLDHVACHCRPAFGYSGSLLFLYNKINVIFEVVPLKGLFERKHLPQEDRKREDVAFGIIRSALCYFWSDVGHTPYCGRDMQIEEHNGGWICKSYA